MAVRGAAIQFRQVHKAYGSFVALESFSMDVAAGEFMTLLGPSGSGKTTALNSLAGFNTITHGDILIDGMSIARLPTEKRNIGMVFQNYSLFPHRTVLGNVAFPLEMRGVPKGEIRQRAAKALEMVRLDGLADRMPHELSGGQKQRVAFARAVVFEPRVLLMDEPLGALDLKLREAMQMEIKQYQREIGCTVIYVTHDQGEALTLSDRVAVMDRGEIQQLGTPEDLYDRPSSRFVAEFIGANNILKISGSTLDGANVDGIGAVRFPGQAQPSDGFLAIRPENIFRKPDGGYPATVRETIFFGDVVRYLVEARNGATLSLVEARTGGKSILGAGSEVKIGFEEKGLVHLTQ